MTTWWQPSPTPATWWLCAEPAPRTSQGPGQAVGCSSRRTTTRQESGLNGSPAPTPTAASTHKDSTWPVAASWPPWSSRDRRASSSASRTRPSCCPASRATHGSGRHLAGTGRSSPLPPRSPRQGVGLVAWQAVGNGRTAKPWFATWAPKRKPSVHDLRWRTTLTDAAVSGLALDMSVSANGRGVIAYVRQQRGVHHSTVGGASFRVGRDGALSGQIDATWQQPVDTTVNVTASASATSITLGGMIGPFTRRRRPGTASCRSPRGCGKAKIAFHSARLPDGSGVPHRFLARIRAA